MTREEAIKEIKSWAIPSKKGREVLETLIPELAESEDERIRKVLVDMVKRETGFTGFPSQGQVLAYLEKQKEPHYTKRNALFDKCVENCDPEVMKEVSDEIDEMLEKEQKPAEWSEEDEKQIAQIERIVKNAGCSKMLQEKIHNWLESLRQQPKVDWGGEDEKWFDYFERLLEFGYNKDPHHLGKLCIDGKMWLKSLRPQPHWKPSEEQMKALEDAFRKDGSDEYRKTINSLYQQLKRL